MLRLLLVEDNARLRPALADGLKRTGAVQVVGATGSGEGALDLGLECRPDVVLMDVQLEGAMDGVAAAVALRRELPRLPIVFYSIQNDDSYFRAFRRAGILTHYAYVRKSNYLLPEMVVPLLQDAVAGRSFVDPEIAARVEEVQQKDEQSPLALLEPNEQVVARMLVQGLSNEQIAARLGFRDKRTISRTNGQIYAAWGLAESATDEKIARTRAAIILTEGRLLAWDEDGQALAMDERGAWVPYELKGGEALPGGCGGLMLFALDPLHPLVPVVVWGARALTFFNVLVLLWLGLTVLLNAERRRLGTWLTGGGLLLGGVCSVARATAQSVQPIEIFEPIDIWWRASWLPFAGAAYLWSVVLTWYAGRLRTGAEWRSLVGLSLLGIVTFFLLLGARPPEVDPDAVAPASASLPVLESVSRTLSRLWRRPPTLAVLAFETAPGDARLALASYLTFAVLCIGLGLHALYRPASTERFMGELAARRALPWLTATSLVTLGLSLVVGIGVTGVPVVTPPILLDLLGAALLSGHVVLLGQAIISYEVFTGKTLPRRGLARYWRNALILAAGFGGLLAVSLGLPLDQSYRLQLALVIVAVFYALLCWRSFEERERSLDQLRPFVTSERLIDHLTSAPAPASVASGRGDNPFRALGEGVLGASVAFLCPVGPLASLVGAPLATPEPACPPAPEVLAALVERIGSAHELCLAIDPATHAGAAWVVPLWGERSLIGLLLLGNRRDDSVYSQEEIEIARAAGERLIDARAAGELARRLLLLQRRRLSEDQVLDSRVRRVLHDDVLPLLHTALLSLRSREAGIVVSSGGQSVEGGTEDEAAALLADAHRQVSALLAELPPSLAPDVARLGLVGALRRVVDDLGGELDEVRWEIDPDGERAAGDLSPLAAEVVFGAAREVIRNAARHARPDDRSRQLSLSIAVAQAADDLLLRIEDDGIGLVDGAGAERDGGGAGQGLILHGTLLTVLGGSLAVTGAPGRGTRVMLRVPTTT